MKVGLRLLLLHHSPYVNLIYIIKCNKTATEATDKQNDKRRMRAGNSFL
jgi:hypothetical protein